MTILHHNILINLHIFLPSTTEIAKYRKKVEYGVKIKMALFSLDHLDLGNFLSDIWCFGILLLSPFFITLVWKHLEKERYFKKSQWCGTWAIKAIWIYLRKINKWTKAVLNTYIIFWFVRHGEESFLGNKFLFSNSDIWGDIWEKSLSSKCISK